MGLSIGAALGLQAVGSVAQGLFNKREAERTRDWQQRMSGTAYQRAAADLEKAGLNRVLALGSPATTPAGATASVGNPNFGQTAIQASSAKQTVAESQTRQKLIRKQASKLVQEIRSAKTEADMNEVRRRLYTVISPAVDKLANDLAKTGGKFADMDIQGIVREGISSLFKSWLGAGEGVVTGLGESAGVPDLHDKAVNMMSDLFLRLEKSAEIIQKGGNPKGAWK